MGNALPELSVTEWVVLALLAEEPSHGFAIASLTARSGAVGRIWYVPRPIVYRSIARLIELKLAREKKTEMGTRGPQRTVIAATAKGQRAAQEWLTEPVQHVREIRSAFLVKLALLDRRGSDNSALLQAQLTVLDPIAASLKSHQKTTEGFARVLDSWRLESVRAATRFIEGLSSPSKDG